MCSWSGLPLYWASPSTFLVRSCVALLCGVSLLASHLPLNPLHWLTLWLSVWFCTVWMWALPDVSWILPSSICRVEVTRVTQCSWIYVLHRQTRRKEWGLVPGKYLERWPVGNIRCWWFLNVLGGPEKGSFDNMALSTTPIRPNWAPLPPPHPTNCSWSYLQVFILKGVSLCVCKCIMSSGSAYASIWMRKKHRFQETLLNSISFMRMITADGRPRDGQKSARCNLRLQGSPGAPYRHNVTQRHCNFIIYAYMEWFWVWNLASLCECETWRLCVSQFFVLYLMKLPLA
jgi:hypothetical protein